MQKLLGNLKGSASHNDLTEMSGGLGVSAEEAVNSDDDKDYIRIASRKVSMNEQNVIGMNFEKYNGEAKPSHEIRRKIANFVLEYRETKDRAHATDSFLEVCDETQIARYFFVGYILHNSFSFEPTGWNEFLELIVDHLYINKKLLTANDLIEG